MNNETIAEVIDILLEIKRQGYMENGYGWWTKEDQDWGSQTVDLVAKVRREREDATGIWR